MNAISRIGDVRPDRRLRFPALPVADSAGTSFKHEHLNAILAEGPQAGFFETEMEWLPPVERHRDLPFHRRVQAPSSRRSLRFSGSDGHGLSLRQR
jgi:hypothetical protein